jgi:branched-chain amino acid transport system substrate-binding protein
MTRARSQHHDGIVTGRLGGLVWVLLFAALFFAACSRTDASVDDVLTLETPGATAAPIRIGAVLPLTGGLADLGTSLRQGATLAADEINARSPGSVDLAIEDGRADPKTSLDAALLFATTGDVPIIVTAFRGASMSIGSGLADHEVIILANTATSQQNALGKENGNFFPIGSEMTAAGRIVGEYAGRDASCTRVGLLSESTDAGRDKLSGFKQGYDASGVYVEQYVQPVENDFRTAVLLFKESGVDCLFFELKPNIGVSLLKQLRELDYAPRLFANSYAITPALVDADPLVLEGAVFSANKLPGTDATMRFKAAYEQRYGAAPDEFAAMMYDFVYLAEQVSRVCNQDVACMKERLRGSSYAGVSGKIDIASTGDGRLSEYVLKTVRAGQIVELGVAS